MRPLAETKAAAVKAFISLSSFSSVDGSVDTQELSQHPSHYPPFVLSKATGRREVLSSSRTVQALLPFHCLPVFIKRVGLRLGRPTHKLKFF
jgi:hypothetical protein